MSSLLSQSSLLVHLLVFLMNSSCTCRMLCLRPSRYSEILCPSELPPMCSHLPVFWISWNLPSRTPGSVVCYSPSSLCSWYWTSLFHDHYRQGFHRFPHLYLILPYQWLAEPDVCHLFGPFSTCIKKSFQVTLWKSCWLSSSCDNSLLADVRELKFLMRTRICLCRDFPELVKIGFTHSLTLIRWSAALEQWQCPSGEELLLWTIADQFNKGSALWSSKLLKFLSKQIGSEELLAIPTGFSRNLKVLSSLQAQSR